MKIFWFGFGWFACLVVFMLSAIYFKWRLEKKKPTSMRSRLEGLKPAQVLADLLNGDCKVCGVELPDFRHWKNQLCANCEMHSDLNGSEPEFAPEKATPGQSSLQEEVGSGPRDGKLRALLMAAQLHVCCCPGETLGLSQAIEEAESVQETPTSRMMSKPPAPRRGEIIK